MCLKKYFFLDFWKVSFVFPVFKNLEESSTSKNSRPHSCSYTFPVYSNNPTNNVLCNTALYVDDTTLYSTFDPASDSWQQLELHSELGYDLRDTVDLGRKWLVDFNAWKTQLLSFDQPNNSGVIDVKMVWSVPEEKSSFKMLGLSFYSKLNLDFYIVSNSKLPSIKS